MSQSTPQCTSNLDIFYQIASQRKYETGKGDRIKRFRKAFSHHCKASTSDSVSNTLDTALQPRLNETTDRANGPTRTDYQSQDAPVGDLWGLALEELPPEDIEVKLGISADLKLDILRYLQAAAVEKRNECEKRSWKLELNGRQIILRDVAEKILVWVDRFKQIGDVVVNFDPVHAALPWAVVRFLLEVGLITLNENHSQG